MYFDQKQVISKSLSFCYNKNLTEEKQSFHIAYGIDKNFLLGCCISITSLLLNNKEQSFHFHIFSDYIDNDFQTKIELLAKQYNTSISIYIINCQELKKLPSTNNWSYAIYFRFIIADVLYPAINRLLYLDADIICKGSLDELVKLDIDDYLVAAVTDRESQFWQKCATRLDIKEIALGYFNSGFLYINLSNWQQDDVSTKAMTLLAQDNIKDKLIFFDQDLLNMIAINKIRFLDKRYNCQYSINYELKASKGTYYQNPINDKTIFIHYIGPTKPWHEWASQYPCSSYFTKAKDYSPWQDDPFITATNASQWRYCKKHRFHQREYILGIISYVKYYWYKLFK